VKGVQSCEPSSNGFSLSQTSTPRGASSKKKLRRRRRAVFRRSPEMSGGDKYPSVFERITWATGFRLAIDKHVLGVLSTFANFRTGKGACPSVPALVARAKVTRSTLTRALRRLREDRWVLASYRGRGYQTVYDINLDKLPMHWMEAKLVPGLNPTSEIQNAVLNPTSEIQTPPILNLTGDQGDLTHEIQTGNLNPISEIQNILNPTGEIRSPVRTEEIPTYKEIPSVIPRSAPALRAGVLPIDRRRTGTLFAIPEAKVPAPNGTLALPDWGDAEVEVRDVASESSAADPDLPTDGGDRARSSAADASVGFWGAARAHQAATSRAGVSARQRSTAPRAPSPDRSGARVGSQPTLGPLDVSAAPVASHWQRLADTFRAALQEKAQSPPPPDATKTNTTTPPTTKPSTQRKSG
jgi:hypothetical protein